MSEGLHEDISISIAGWCLVLFFFLKDIKTEVLPFVCLMIEVTSFLFVCLFYEVLHQKK